MAVQNTQGRTVNSVANTLRIVRVLRERNGATVSELSNCLELSVGTIHPHLTTLKEHGYVVQNGDRYRLGPHFLSLGDHVRNHCRIYQPARDEINRLAQETGECTHLITEHQGQAFTVYEEFGEDAVGMDFYIKNREKPRHDLHCTAAGKAILSRLPDDRVEQIITDQGLPQRTDNTVTEPDELREELARVREQGYAVNDEEEVPRLRAVGAPIVGQDDAVLGAVSISAPTSRVKEEQAHTEIAELVIESSNIIEINLQFSTE